MEAKEFTTADLKRWLDEFLKRHSDSPAVHDIWPSSPRGEALMRSAEIVYAYSRRSGESFAQTEARLADARRLFLDLLSAVKQQSIPGDIVRDLQKIEAGQTDPADTLVKSLTSGWLDQDIWYHRDDLFDEFTNSGYPSEDLEFRAGYISSYAAELIQRPWLDSRFIEWVIVDSLVCECVRAFGQSVLLGHVGFRGLWVALFGNESVPRIKGRNLVSVRVRRWLIRILFLFALPLAAVWYGAQEGYVWVFIAGAVVGGGYLCWSAYVTARAEIFRLLGRQPPNSATQQQLELFLLMHDAYRTLEGPVIDPNRVRKALDAAAEKGASWNGAVYAILNRVIARNPIAWVTNDSHSYRAQDEMPSG